MTTFYLWVKAIHVIAVITWMAGILYLLRLYVYHAQEQEAVTRARFEIMERRLLKGIATPSMIVTWVCGLTMVGLQTALFKQGWFHGKFLAVILLSGVHGMAAGWRKRLIKDPTFKSHKFFRVWNEVPTVLMIFIVIMVIVRPF